MPRLSAIRQATRARNKASCSYDASTVSDIIEAAENHARPCEVYVVDAGFTTKYIKLHLIPLGSEYTQKIVHTCRVGRKLLRCVNSRAVTVANTLS